MSRRRGLSVVELIVAIGIIAVLVGLLLPAVQKVRESATRASCANNLRQVILAVHHYAGAHAGEYPTFSAREHPATRALYAILPYLDHGNYYRDVQSGAFPLSSKYVLKQYMCPSDPSVALPDAKGRASYACNALVFAADYPHRQYPDGSSNTVTFAEHYAFDSRGAMFGWLQGGNATSFYNPVLGRVTSDRRATFADVGDVVPVRSGTLPGTVGSIPGLTFQVRPRLEDCDPRIPQTPHPGGMLVALGDGSVRTLNPGMSASTFWGAVTPDKGEVLGPDW